MRTKPNRMYPHRKMESVDPAVERMKHYDRILKLYDKGLNWVVKLRAHTSCVNAVNFSQNGGRWLASGGDDLRILLWDMHNIEVTRPVHTFVGPSANIFELAFTAANSHLLCGGVDTIVRRYDFTRIGETFDPDPVSVFSKHNDIVRSISPHVTNDDLYMTASEEGRLFYHDARSRTPVGHLEARQGWVGVQFHPRLEHLFIGATDKGTGKVSLFDLRKCFSDASSHEDKVLMRYATQAIGENPIGSSLCGIAFDRSGERFATVSQGHYPTVYSISDPYPIAVCTATHLPSGEKISPNERTYTNACTIKHISFGGPPSVSPVNFSSDTTPSTNTDQYIATGSDDFRGYVWSIPSTSYLMENRKEIDNSGDGWKSPPDHFGYVTSALDDSLHVPVVLDRPAFRLGGHQSIVNTARWHPELPRIVTCGIESKVVVHECSEALKGAVLADSSRVRKRNRRRTWRRVARTEWTDETSEEISDEGDKGTIDHFDSILLREEGSTRRYQSISFDIDEDDEELSDDMRGGTGDLNENETLIGLRVSTLERTRILAMLTRLLADSGELETNTGEMTSQLIRIMRGFQGVLDEEDEERQENEGEANMDTSE
ncbi:WD40 repeat-like protein [Serendipita vermifera]|nr:WD40 repeat-like protein [Serendipita vermifera]